MILAQQGFNLFYQFWIHTETVKRMPRWFEYLFNTPSHHRVHHASNPRYLDRNYAGMLILWDRLFGTFVAERTTTRRATASSRTSEPTIRCASRSTSGRRSSTTSSPRSRGARRLAPYSQRPAGGPTDAERPRRTFATNGAYAIMRVEPRLTGLSGNEIYCMRLKGLTPSGVVIGNSIQSMGFLGGVRSAFRGTARRSASSRVSACRRRACLLKPSFATRIPGSRSRGASTCNRRAPAAELAGRHGVVQYRP